MTKVAKFNRSSASKFVQGTLILRSSLSELVSVCEKLAEQQAMEDPFWKPAVKHAKDLLDSAEVIPGATLTKLGESDSWWCIGPNSGVMSVAATKREAVDKALATTIADMEVLDACRSYAVALYQVSLAYDNMPKKRYDEFDKRRYIPENELFLAEHNLDTAKSELQRAIVRWYRPDQAAIGKRKRRTRSR